MKNKKSQHEALLNKEELKKIFQSIEKQSPYSKRVKIIVVTKKQPYQAIEEAYRAGIKNIGENQIQELENKIKNKKLPIDLKIHLIGHLQTNKTKKAVKMCDYIQTVDSIKIAEKINKEAKKIKKKQKIYLQINIGEDPQKYGFFKKNIMEACQKIVQMENVEVRGIMTILPFSISKEKTTKLYKQTSKTCGLIKEKHIQTCTEISMGMSRDYRRAISCGATNLRIGTKLYGRRK
jgi:hypothetical protein